MNVTSSTTANDLLVVVNEPTTEMGLVELVGAAVRKLESDSAPSALLMLVPELGLLGVREGSVLLSRCNLDVDAKGLLDVLSGLSSREFLVSADELPRMIRAVAGTHPAGVGQIVERVTGCGVSLAATGGCFDGLHDGHLAFLRQCMSLCDHLTVFLNTDESVRSLKGAARPLHRVDYRLDRMYAALRTTDTVEVFSVATAVDCLERVAPDLFFKGSDYWLRRVPEAADANPPIPVLLVDSILEMHTSEMLKRSGRNFRR